MLTFDMYGALYPLWGEQRNCETPFPVKFKIGDGGHIFNF